ncbi:hypothetical protein F8568_037845 [Actinomadura sp. LD22]|uniref:Uncharacterized protein n=1 Tax=Actinomadura physcomitrii TaxID=2650748 RepID=A0A6I4MTL2_9ACTN|nr:hypothetical protein [Actinomadura physcomitrii]MWA06019.1 hypothetical protein [Actinomadura physcomitrii]
MTQPTGPAPGSGPLPYDQARYQELTRGIAVLLAQAAPAGWRRIDLRIMMTVAVSDAALTVAMEDGTTRPTELPRDILDMAAELRSIMYRQDRGTWLSMRVMLDPPGSYYTSFNNDYDPHWDPDIPDDAYAQDLAAFPRADESVPGWLRARTVRPALPPEPVRPLGPVEQKDLLEDLTSLLVDALPAGWQQADVYHNALGSHAESLAQLLMCNTHMPSLWTPPPAAGDLFDRLRRGMYADGLGTWFTARFVLTFPFSYQIEYTRDTEPRWKTAPAPSAYAEDLELFPREPANTPAWLHPRG